MNDWKRKIALFLSSQSISLFGSSIVQYAIMWHITLTTQSGMMMTLFIICGFIPTFLLSPFAGVWADRYNRKILIMLADSFIALATFVLAILYLAGFQYIWLLFVIAAVRAFGTAVQTPAVGAILPQIVPEDKLMRINGVNGSLQAAIMFISPMISAALLSVSTLELILFVDIITAIIAVLTLSFLKMAKQQVVSAEQTDYLADFKAGIHYIREHAFLKNIFFFFAILFFLMAPASFLTPLQITRSFGDDVWRLTVIELTFSVGMIVGGGLIAAWGGMKNHIHTMILSGFVFGLCTLAFGIVPNFWLYSIIMFICGIALPIFNTPTMTMLQEKVEPSYLGRIFGVFSMISSSMMPIGMLLFGPLADVIAIEIILIITGALMILLILLLAKNKVLLAAGQRKTNVTQKQKGLSP